MPIQNVFEKSHQLIVVTTEGWESVRGELCLFERVQGEWELVSEKIPVVVGEKGMAWGRGLHPDAEGPIKQEGDLKSPAGVFTLRCGFGTPLEGDLKIPYLSLSPSIEAVDDPHSLYYNQIVNRDEIPYPDWKSSEKMYSEPLYVRGAVVNHNFPDPTPGFGSAIFLHVWRDPSLGTAGCTAMSLENMEKVLKWLDPRAEPLLIQLPQNIKEETCHFLKNI
jgi:D-alanyl-D-alanine dipeptidase